MNNKFLILFLSSALVMICICFYNNNYIHKNYIHKKNMHNINIKYPIFKFKELSYDFGNVRDGDTVLHKFIFINIGSVPLVISDISTGCGCTVVRWPKNSIKPNEGGEIIVQFSKKHDPGIHVKNAIIKANTKDPYSVLRVLARVK